MMMKSLFQLVVPRASFQILPLLPDGGRPPGYCFAKARRVPFPGGRLRFGSLLCLSHGGQLFAHALHRAAFHAQL